MKYLNLFILSFCLLTLPPVFAQQTEFGSESESSSYRNMPFFLGQKDGKTYTIRVTGYSAGIYSQLLRNDAKAAMGAMLIGLSKFSNDAPFNTQRLYFGQNSRVYLEIYDEALRQISSKELNLDEKPKGDPLRIVRFAMINGKIYAFSFQESDKGETNRLLAHAVSMEGELEKPGAELLSYTTKNYLISGRKSQTFNIYPTPDGNHFMVTRHELRFPKSQKAEKSIHLHFFNSELQQQWTNEFSPAIQADEAELTDIKISNQGDAACLFKFRSPDKSGQEDIYTLFTYMKTKDLWDEFTLSVKRKFTNDILLNFSDNRLSVSGFYSGQSKSSAEGYFLREISTSTGEILRDSEEGFTKEFMTLALGEKKAQNAEALGNFHMRNIISLEDGGVVLVAEKYYILYNNNSFNFNYDDVFMIRLDNSGKWIQSGKVMKTQQTSDDGGMFSSYCVISNNNEIVFIYNANRNDPKDRMTNTNRASVYLTRIPFDGSKQTTEMLFNGKEAETVAVPKVYLQESGKSVVFYNYKRGAFKYARVKF